MRAMSPKYDVARQSQNVHVVSGKGSVVYTGCRVEATKALLASGHHLSPHYPLYPQPIPKQILQ